MIIARKNPVTNHFPGITKMVRLFAFLSALLIAGCATIPTDPASGINKATGRIHARAESISEQASQIENAPIGTPIQSVKPLATSIRTQAGWIVVDVGEVDERVKALEKELSVERVKYQKLESKWYVTWGRRIERAFWILTFSYVALGLIAIFLPVRLPVAGLEISKHIIRFVPFMNWASFFRDRLIGRKGK